MYRTLIPLILYAISVAAAPQDGANSDITYVKIQPVTDDNYQTKLNYRESRIENIPLTIPGKVTNVSSAERDSGDNNGNVTAASGNKAEDGSRIKEEGSNVEDSRSTEVKHDDEKDRNVTDNARRARSEYSTSSYESETVEPTEIVTETVEDLLQQTEEYESRTKAPSPRFLSKLSYFQKDQDVRSSIATNLLERTGKRKYKTKCRCEKIWNCPKLQITVPRCPNEYFLCCF